jgi:hypothetical protein
MIDAFVHHGPAIAAGRGTVDKEAFGRLAEDEEPTTVFPALAFLPARSL